MNTYDEIVITTKDHIRCHLWHRYSVTVKSVNNYVVNKKFLDDVSFRLLFKNKI